MHWNIEISSAPYSYSQISALSTDLIEGKVIITSIADGVMDRLQRGKVDIGTEIVSVNGVSVNVILDELETYIATGKDTTRRKIAAWTLLRRRGARMPGFESKELILEVRKKDAKATQKVLLNIFEVGDKLPTIQKFQPNKPKAKNFFSQIAELTTESMLGVLPGGSADVEFMCSGQSRIAIPVNATMIVEKPFTAYYYPTEKGNIGYLRIPHYSPSPESVEELSVPNIGEFRFQQYEYAVRELEKNTVGLVIDQDHNCGGSVTWLEKFLGLFMTENYAPTQFRFRSSREEYLDWSGELQSSGWANTTIDYVWWESVVGNLRHHWLAGNYLTNFSSFSEGPYQPNFIHYTKPIIVLIDEMSGSGGDAFPSLIKGYGRAKLLGKSTSGLGGHVVSFPTLTYSRMSGSLTKSLFYRPDGVEVENNGAVPDIDYDITVEDVMSGYIPYREFYTQKLLEMIEATPVDGQL